MKFRFCRSRILNVFQFIFITSILLMAYLSFRHNKLYKARNLSFKETEVIVLPVVSRSPGEMGAPVHLPAILPKKVQHLINIGWQKYKFNKFVSDLIPLNRSLPNAQDEWCRQPGRFLNHLPVTDVIICFYNEAWSTLLRTVHSVIDRSPDHLIGQIILVDDCSSESYLKEPLNRYFSTFAKVKIERASTRQGIARARLMGMEHSAAPILTYLDSHCECMEGWLEPLLDRIAHNPSTIVTPAIDIIDMTTFEYLAPPLRNENVVGGFNWNLEFTWFQSTEREKGRHEHDMSPLPTPTIAGGLFSIDRKFFEYIETYDLGFEYWGAENLELSFKTWMCGGRMEVVYCSRVGHVFRDESPHEYPSADQVITNNLVRLAEVWLDDYAKIFYTSLGRAFNKSAAQSDVTDRKLLRKKLGCKTFKWYLENVIPEKFVPVAFGAIVQKTKNVCLDAKDKKGNVNIMECHNHGENQFWMIGDFGEIRKDETCLSINIRQPVLTECIKDNANQHWIFDNRTHHIFNKASGECLTLSNNFSYVFMKKCHKASWWQYWSLQL